MNVRKTALLMILWLFCQQAAAITAPALMDPVQPDSTAAVQTPASCHDDDSSASPAASCCNFDCQCCFGGCQSMLCGNSSQVSVVSAIHPADHYGLAFPQTPAHSVFRPPISP